MTRTVVRQLIRKDLYLYRWLIVGTVVAGLVSIVLSGREGTIGAAGQILLVTSVVVLGVFLAIHGVISERQTRALLFALSLPISPMQYSAAKVVGGLIAYLIPWSILTAALVWLTLAFNPAAADALPFAVTLMGLLFMNFCILTTIGVISGSELWSVVGIIATNTSVPVFMTAVSPMLASASDGSMAVWRGPVAVILLTELLITVLALGSAFYVLSRRTDFVQGGSA
jgi:ABC-2 type transport system permease protein